MTSFITHMGIGIILAEIVLRLIDDDPEFRKDKRALFWFAGLIGGLAPDLDVIPALITGEHYYTYHHIYTHTFLALGILFILVILTKFNPYMLIFFLAFLAHLGTDFMDNSISPLGPFDISIEWGLLCGWQEIPCVDGVCGWASEFWLLPGYETHDLWSVFMNNGWGIPIGFEFLSYYDLALMAISTPLILATLIMLIKKPFSK